MIMTQCKTWLAVSLALHQFFFFEAKEHTLNKITANLIQACKAQRDVSPCDASRPPSCTVLLQMSYVKRPGTIKGVGFPDSET